MPLLIYPQDGVSPAKTAIWINQFIAIQLWDFSSVSPAKTTIWINQTIVIQLWVFFSARIAKICKSPGLVCSGKAKSRFIKVKNTGIHKLYLHIGKADDIAWMPMVILNLLFFANGRRIASYDTGQTLIIPKWNVTHSWISLNLIIFIAIPFLQWHEVTYTFKFSW